MYEKLAEKGDLLNDRVNHFAAIYADHIQKNIATIDEESVNVDAFSFFAHPLIPSQAKQYYCGRVSVDSLVDGVALNLQSMVLESSRELGAGARVEMVFDEEVVKDEELDLFPGYIIAVEATNPTGNRLIVSRIFHLPTLDTCSTIGSDYKSYYCSDGGYIKGTKIAVCAGPYVMHDALDFSIFEKFVIGIEANPPDVMIMLGPFIPYNHPSILTGAIGMDEFEAFSQGIGSLIRYHPAFG